MAFHTAPMIVRIIYGGTTAAAGLNALKYANYQVKLNYWNGCQSNCPEACWFVQCSLPVQCDTVISEEKQEWTP